MILHWTKRDSTFTAEWHAQKLVLQQEFKPGVGRRWYMTANGKRVAHRGVPMAWYTARAAMDAVDARQQHYIMQLARERAVHHVHIPKNEVTAELLTGSTVHRQHRMFEDGTCEERFVKEVHNA